jgi:hypothetical protein
MQAVDIFDHVTSHILSDWNTMSVFASSVITFVAEVLALCLMAYVLLLLTLDTVWGIRQVISNIRRNHFLAQKAERIRQNNRDHAFILIELDRVQTEELNSDLKFLSILEGIQETKRLIESDLLDEFDLFLRRSTSCKDLHAYLTEKVVMDERRVQSPFDGNADVYRQRLEEDKQRLQEMTDQMTKIGIL